MNIFNIRKKGILATILGMLLIIVTLLTMSANALVVSWTNIGGGSGSNYGYLAGGVSTNKSGALIYCTDASGNPNTPVVYMNKSRGQLPPASPSSLVSRYGVGCSGATAYTCDDFGISAIVVSGGSVYGSIKSFVEGMQDDGLTGADILIGDVLGLSPQQAAEEGWHLVIESVFWCARYQGGQGCTPDGIFFGTVKDMASECNPHSYHLGNVWFKTIANSIAYVDGPLGVVAQATDGVVCV